MIHSIAERFIDEKLDESCHWVVSQSDESFERLLKHIQVKTHFYHCFYNAFDYLLASRDEDELTIADVGGGVGWTTALMAKHPRVQKAYLVEPSVNRVKSFQPICRHWNVDPQKVEAIDGSFQEFNLPDKVDVILMCASIHHCDDDYTGALFSNIERYLRNPKGKARVLVANEHYVNVLFSLRHRLYPLIKNYLKGKNPYWWTLGDLRRCHPTSYEHWRTKSELDSIFNRYGYKANYNRLSVDLCNDKPFWDNFLMWQYYFATLDKE